MNSSGCMLFKKYFHSNPSDPYIASGWIINKWVLMSHVLQDFAARLDARAFAGFRIWQFSLLNAWRAFSWYYLFRLLLMHPLKTVRGLARYRGLIRSTKDGSLKGTAAVQDVMNIMQRRVGRLLIAPGFCMKPYDYTRGKSTCPVGHFNHSCLLLNNANELLFQKEKWPGACSICGVAPLAQLAAQNNADLYIMTSAKDIARDVYLPAIQQTEYQAGLFFLCSYSNDAFTFGLSMSDIKGAIIEFCSGDCQNHHDWTQADVGCKNDQTFVDSAVWTNLLETLTTKAERSSVAKRPSFEQRGRIYRNNAANGTMARS